MGIVGCRGDTTVNGGGGGQSGNAGSGGNAGANGSSGTAGSSGTSGAGGTTGHSGTGGTAGTGAAGSGGTGPGGTGGTGTSGSGGTGNAGSGGTGATGGGGTGGTNNPPECTLATKDQDCASTTITECEQHTCTNGVCGVQSKSDGTGCSVGVCHAGACVSPSCIGLAANCGANGNDDCCSTKSIASTSFMLGNDSSSDGAAKPAKLVTLSSFSIDKYETTVGRFRNFYNDYDTFYPMLSAASPNTLGAHANTSGVGWNVSPAAWGLDSVTMPTNKIQLLSTLNTASSSDCDVNSRTWSESPNVFNDAKPMNCVNWFLAYAFCIWDGGRLPTEAEWELAAGGSQEYLYPWGAPAPASNYLVYACAAGDLSCLLRVGSKPNGASPSGLLDMAGSVREWTFDRYEFDAYTRVTAGSTGVNTKFYESGSNTYHLGRSLRGGGWMDSTTSMFETNFRSSWNYPEQVQARNGLRCARN